MLKRSTNYLPISVLIFTAWKHSTQGIQEENKNNFRNALSCYTEGIALKCRDDKLNAGLYLLRANVRQSLGEFS